MHRFRMAAIAAMSVCAFALVSAGSASAQSTASVPMTKKVAITGTAKNGKKFTGTYTIKRFQAVAGKMYAVGTLTGTLKGRQVKRSNVSIPATLTGSDSSAQS